MVAAVVDMVASWSQLGWHTVVIGVSWNLALRDVITSASPAPRQHALPPAHHVSHLYFHTSADRRHHCRRPTTITPQPRQMTTITNSPSWTIEGGDNHRQLIGTTSKCFLLSVSCFILLTIYFSADSHCPICTVHIFFFPFFRFTNYLPSRSFGLPCLRFARP